MRFLAARLGRVQDVRVIVEDEQPGFEELLEDLADLSTCMAATYFPPAPGSHVDQDD